jgi:hypothetical protein
MMVLSRATRNVLRRTETIRRTVFAVDCFGWRFFGLPGSSLAATSWRALPVCVLAKSDGSLEADLVLWGVVGLWDTMVTVKLAIFYFTAEDLWVASAVEAKYEMVDVTGEIDSFVGGQRGMKICFNNSRWREISGLLGGIGNEELDCLRFHYTKIVNRTLGKHEIGGQMTWGQKSEGTKELLSDFIKTRPGFQLVVSLQYDWMRCT